MTEKQIRNKLKRNGYGLRKGKDAYGFDGYMIINSMNNTIEIGMDNFNYSLEEVENWIKQNL